MKRDNVICKESVVGELFHRFKYNKSAVFGLIIIIFIIFCAFAADIIAPNDPSPSPPNLSNTLKPGFWSKEGAVGMPLGSDDLGRCILSRTLYGARISLKVGLIAVSIATVLGIILGTLAGYYGGRVENVIMRITDIMFSFPSLLLAIVIATVLGRGLDKAMIAIGIVFTPQMARVIRGSVLYIKEMEYIEIQKAIGSNHWRIIFRHILPNSIAPVIVYSTLMLASAITTCAGLGFLGLGAQPPTPEWGAMLSNSYSYIISGAWWAATFPGIAILLSVLGLNLLGDGLRDIMDPRLKQ